MAMYPDIQKKVQAELHSLVGPNRLLEPSDLPDLIYTRAVLLETLRWKPVIPMGLPHRLLQDDEYNGFFIPAGTIVLSVRFYEALAHASTKQVFCHVECVVCLWFE